MQLEVETSSPRLARARHVNPLLGDEGDAAEHTLDRLTEALSRRYIASKAIVAANPQNRAQIFDLVEVFRARIVDLTSESLMIEMTGVESKIEGLIEVLREDEGRILEICRSGKMTMRRGHHFSSVIRAMGTQESEAEEITVTPSQ